MIRRLALTVMPLLVVAGCADSGESSTPTGFWFTAPQSDNQRLEVLHRARAIDACALIPRAELAKLGAIRTVESNQPDSCKAEMGSEEDHKGTELQWAVVVGTVQQGAKTTETTIDGTNVLLGDNRENVPEALRDKLLERKCTAMAQFPAGAVLMMFVTTPLDTDACRLAERLLHPAIAAWQQEPRHGTSPDTIRTVLTDADPCDVLPKLGATVNPTDRRMRTCDFTYRGDDVSVSYGYDDEKIIPGVNSGEQRTDLGNNHVVYRSTSDTYHYYSAVLGPALNPANPSPTYGPTLPNVTVMGKNDEALTDVMRQVLTLFP